MVLIKIAFRNLLQHKAKTLIIGSLIVVGTIILVIGNSVLDTAVKGIRNTFINGYTGNIVITAKSGEPVSLFGSLEDQALILFGATTYVNSQIPKLPDYPKIITYLEQHPQVSGFSPQIFGLGLINCNLHVEDVYGADSMFFGIDPVQYRKLFPENMEIIEGRFLNPGEKGMLISEDKKEELSRYFGYTGVGNNVRLYGTGATSFRIREIPVVGVFKLKNKSNDMLNKICFVDENTLRSLIGMSSGSGKISPVDSKALDLFNSASLDDLMAQTRARAEALFRHGTTTAEAKSGYGLTVEDARMMGIDFYSSVEAAVAAEIDRFVDDARQEQFGVVPAAAFVLDDDLVRCKARGLFGANSGRPRCHDQNSTRENTPT